MIVGRLQIARALLLAGACGVALTIAEMSFRRLDGYVVFATRLRPRGPIVAAPETAQGADRRYVAGVRRAAGVDPAWYFEDPLPYARHPLEPWQQERFNEYVNDPSAAFFEWNRANLAERACKGESDASLRSFLYFDAIEPGPYPSFRHYRHMSSPGWFVANSFGWRGPEISLNKPADTIRIAFVGASTTISPYSMPFSHPEFIGHWLNRWSAVNGRPYRFEVVNAGRTGIDSHSIAAIVRQELAPVEPDLVVFYEGANQFWPAREVRYRFARLYPKPTTTYLMRPGENRSAIVKRTLGLVDRITGRDGSEPPKPAMTPTWAGIIDEQNPNPDDPRLPMALPAIVPDLDSMQAAIRNAGGELVVSSFLWMVEDGMKLDLRLNMNIYDFLNRTYWPIPYAHMRRMADLQNRVFANYARARGLPFIDLAAEFPLDPDLFGDAIHMRPWGLRLQAWIYLQHLIPLIESRVAAGRLPQPMHHPRTTHPAFDQPAPRFITLDQLRAGCSASHSQ
jgi:hypothetical protein